MIKIDTLILYLRILKNLSLRNIKIRYRQAAIGIIWAALKPTITVLIFLIVFKLIIKMNIKTGIHYELYLLSGIIPWFFFSQTFNDIVLSMLDNPNFISKISLSKTLIPLSYILVNSIELAFMVVAYVFISIIIYSENMSIYFPFILLLLIVFTYVIGLSFSVLIIFYKDIKHIIPIILQAGIFLSPIAYPIDLVPGKFLAIYFLNPITGFIELFRWTIFLDYKINLDYVMISMLSALIFCIASIVIYQKNKNKLAELI